jgi:EAL domain-containing protein (putative c-di-GMP-specific phosphodiesterase class I)
MQSACRVLLLLTLMLAFNGQALEVIVDDSDRIDLDQILPTLIVTNDSQLQPDQLKSFSIQHYPESIKPSKNGSWYKLTITPHFSTSQSQHRTIAIGSHIIRHLHLYLYDKDTLIKHKEIGLINTHNKILHTDSTNYQGPRFDFNLQNGSPLTLLIYKQNDGPSILPMTLYSDKGLHKSEREINIFWGGILCILLVLALYNIIIYSIHPNNAYLWYIGFHSLAILYFGGLNGFGYLIFPLELQVFLAQNIMMLNFLVVFFLINFSATFLEIEKYAENFLRFIKPMNIVSIAGAFICLSTPEYITIPFFIVLQIFASILGISMAITSYRNNYKPAKFFLLSWSFTLTGAAIGMGTAIGQLPANFFNLHGFLFGTLAELFLFSVALAHRMKDTEHNMLSQSYFYPDTAMGNFSYLKKILPTLLPKLVEKHHQLVFITSEIHGLKELTSLYGPSALSDYYRSQTTLISEHIQGQPWAVPMMLPSKEIVHLVALPGEQIFLMAAVASHYSEAKIQEEVHGVIQALTIKFDELTEASNHNVKIRLTSGCSIYTSSINFEDNFRQTQVALLTAQKQNNKSLFYSNRQDQTIKDLVSLMSDLECAIKHHVLELHIQPQFSLDKNTLNSGEILLRWLHPTQGYIGPHIFIPLAEKTGLVFEITQFVIENTCKWLRNLKNEHPDFYNNFEVSINLSALDMAQDQLIPYLQNTTEHYGIESNKIILEVTESAVLSNTDLFLHTIGQLKSLGFKVSIDDFGTGYSSMQYLQTMKADELKIDMTFVRGIHNNPVSQSIAKAIIQLAHATGATTVAEGIEAEEEMLCLRLLKCTKAQGYYCSQAIPLKQFEREYIKPH